MPIDADAAVRRDGGEMRLACVFDQRQMMTGGDRFERVHVGWLSVEMHGQDRARARRDRRRRCRGIEREALGIDVGEHRARPGHHDGKRRVGRRERSGNHLVARRRYPARAASM